MMVVIFVFSMMEGDESSAASGLFLSSVAGIIGGIVHGELGEAFLGNLHIFIRKCAHFTEYAMYGASLGYAIWYFWKSRRFPYILPVAIAFIYACTDELHQYFVPGRYCTFMDVIIDTAGALCGLVIYVAIYNKKHKNG